MVDIIKLAKYNEFYFVFDNDNFDSTTMTDPDDKMLFKEQEEYALIIMIQTFQSSGVKDFVCDNPDNARKLYKDYFEYIQKSPHTADYFHKELTSLFQTPLSAHRGLKKTYVSSMEKIFLDYNAYNVVTIPGNLKVTFM